MTFARGLLLAAIRGYKRHLSPRKGFACAYRIHRGACSCSTLGLRAISRYGAWRGLGVLRLRLEQCHLVAEEFRARAAFVRAAQGGFIDCGLPCDASCIDVSSCTGWENCDVAACYESDNCDACGDCGWSSSRPTQSRQMRRRRRGEPVPEQAAPGDVPSAGQ